MAKGRKAIHRAGTQRREEKKGDSSAFDRRFRGTLSKSRKALAARRSAPTKKENARKVWVATAGEGRRGVGVRGAGRVSALQRGKRGKGGETRLITAHGSREDGAWAGLVQSFREEGEGAIYHAPQAWLRALLRVTPVIWFRLSAHLRQTGWLDG